LRIFAIYNLKGGVGKTTTAVNLAYLSAVGGARTLVWDLDPQGAASFYFRIKPHVRGGGERLLAKKKRLPKRIKGTDFEGLDLLPADFSYRNMDLHLDERKKPEGRLAKLLGPLAEEYDHVFLDCPPSISLTSEAVFTATDALVVPVIPTPLSLRALEQIRDYLGVRKASGRPRLLPFFSMVDRRKKLHRETCENAEESFLETVIPYLSAVEQMGLQRAPLVDFAPRSSVARSYHRLWAEIRERLGDEPKEI